MKPPQTTCAAPDLQRDRSRLTRIIEGEIVPRLLMSMIVARSALKPAAMAVTHPATDEVNELARLLLSHDIEIAIAYVQIIRGNGTAGGTLYTELLVPTAWRLRELWQRQECELEALTAALSRLESVIRQVSGTLDRGGSGVSL